MNKTPERRLRVNFKNKTPTGVWKDRFRKGCLDRLKNKRSEYVNNLRQVGDDGPTTTTESPLHESSQERINQVMLDEWVKMKLESPVLSTLPQFECSSNKRFKFDFGDELEDKDIDEILNVFEDIQKDLLREEMLILQEYEESVSFDDQALCAAIDMLTTNSVACPICKKNNLIQNKHVIFCACGLRIDTQNDAIDLQFVERQLMNLISCHSASCHGNPEFELMSMIEDNVKNIIMTCVVCDCLEIVI